MELVRKTIGRMLDEVTAAYPNNDALIHTEVGARYNYTLFSWEIGRVARGLMKMGIEKGDRVALWAPNCAGRVAGGTHEGRFVWSRRRITWGPLITAGASGAGAAALEPPTVVAVLRTVKAIKSAPTVLLRASLFIFPP